MKLNFRLISKIGLLLVVFGFFMPISCQLNGFQLARAYSEFGDAILGVFLYLLFFSALAGCAIGVLLLLKKNVKLSYDWICLFVCIASGLIVFFASLSGTFRLQSGAFFILIGWAFSLIFQIKYRSNKVEFEAKNIISKTESEARNIVEKISGNTKVCPFCANKIKEEAIVCHFCKKDLPAPNS
jgi:predicted membrane protein